MAALFNPPNLPAIPAPPPMPTNDTSSVSKAGSDAVKKQTQAQGRASTYLTNPLLQRRADASAQRYLGMA